MTCFIFVLLPNLRLSLFLHFLICEAMIFETNIKTRNLQLDFRKFNRQID